MDDKQNRIEMQEEIDRLRAEVERLGALSKNCDLMHHDLVESEARYRNLVELAADAIFMGDPQGKIIGANRSAVGLTGYAVEELLEMNLGMLFSAEESAATPLRYDLLKAGKILQNERVLTRKDGSVVAIGMNSRMMPDGTYHTFMRDYTQRRANEARMLSLIRDLEAFTLTVSHDLRGPLTNLLLSTEVLESCCADVLDEQGMRVLRVIERSATDMLALVENLLALARAEQIERQSEAVDCDEVLKKVLDGLSLRLETDDVEIKATPLPALKIHETFISQIFNNLIGNALNYAAAPGSVIEIGGERRGGNAHLYVRDQGPGIPEGEREQIFETFYRGNNGKGQTGSGLGLAIVARICQAFDGRSWVEETPGGGCTFYVELARVV
jgi:PAS domain S-box-containing protein